jgi:hypothetical protein
MQSPVAGRWLLMPASLTLRGVSHWACLRKSRRSGATSPPQFERPGVPVSTIAVTVAHGPRQLRQGMAVYSIACEITKPYRSLSVKSLEIGGTPRAL